MRLWHFSSSVNSFFKRTCAAIQVGLDVWSLVRTFVYFHALCVWTASALARLRECAGLPEPSLVACVTSTIISWAGSIICFSSLLGFYYDLSPTENQVHLPMCFLPSACLVTKKKKKDKKENYSNLSRALCILIIKLLGDKIHESRNKSPSPTTCLFRFGSRLIKFMHQSFVT